MVLAGFNFFFPSFAHNGTLKAKDSEPIQKAFAKLHPHLSRKLFRALSE